MKSRIIVVFLLSLTQSIVTQAIKDYSSFGYTFPVSHTEKCPLTAEEWENSSRRLGCNKTHGYHCVPDKKLSSLIEFCYPRGESFMFVKGNCLELADTGILNHVKCGNFSFGCPDKDYPSKEFYKYPSCLSIAANCFTADVECLKQRCNGVPKTEDRSTNCPCEGHIYILLLVIPLFGSIVCNMYLIYRCLQRRDNPTENRRPEEEQTEGNHPELPAMEGNLELDPLLGRDNPTENRRPKEEQAEENHPGFSIMKKSREVGPLLGGDTKAGNRRPEEKKAACSEEELCAEYAIQDAELFKLLKRQCQNGVYNGFHHLLESRVKSKEKEYIFCQRDDNGCTLLHYAAEGGSTTILDEILKIPSTDVSIKCYRGRTVLHYAIKHKQKRMIEHLIINKNKFLDEYTQSPGEGSEISRKECFEPLHWAAWSGDIDTLDMLINRRIDPRRLTRNGLSILDIACLQKQPLFCLHILENEKRITLDKRDSCGWNIAHYAARSNDVEMLLKHLSGKEEHLITDITKDNKTTLHIACEYGQFEAVKHLTKTCKSLLFRTDERGWNALYYATKGGNLEIIQFLLKDKTLDINSLAKDGKTLLHVACIHKHVDICKYIVDIFSKGYKDLINKTTDQGWLPAHYVGVEKKGDGSEEEIMDILMDCKMDLSKTTGKGHSIVTVAVNHLNKNLVKHLVSEKYIDVFGIPRMINELERAMKGTEDIEMKDILDDGLRTCKRKRDF